MRTWTFDKVNLIKIARSKNIQEGKIIRIDYYLRTRFRKTAGEHQLQRYHDYKVEK